MNISEDQYQKDKNEITQVVKDMCHKDYNKGRQYMHKSCLFIRPSGNPLDMDGWDFMMKNPNVKIESNDLLSINKLHINGDMAYVCYTTRGVFNYMGTQNDDVAVLTSILEKIDGKWLVVHGQRSTGRKPGDPFPIFPKKN
jgi:ketosteroid isomerase-like protein